MSKVSNFILSVKELHDRGLSSADIAVQLTAPLEYIDTVINAYCDIDE